MCIFESDADKESTRRRILLALAIGTEDSEHVDKNGRHAVIEWLDVDANEALRRAAKMRDDGLLRCQTDKDRVEFLQYRLLDHYWLGDLESASKDVADLGALAEPTDPQKLWYEHVIPALIAAEQRDSAIVRRPPDASLFEAMNSVDYRRATSIACALYLLGDSDAARDFLMEATAGVNLEKGLSRTAPADWWSHAWQSLSGAAPSIEADWPDRSTAGKLNLAPVFFFRAVVALGNADRESARKLLLDCENCYDYENYSYLARMLRRRMEAAPAWPPWIPNGDRTRN